MRVLQMVVVALVTAAIAAAADDPPGRPDVPDWSTLRAEERFPELAWLAGEWRGYGKFPTRHTLIHKSYEFDVGGMFMTERTVDMFPPPELSTDFEVHQDLTVFYRDHGALKAKSFFVEGFVTCSKVTEGEDGSIVLETVEVENGPAGLRTRFSIIAAGEDRFTGTFEMATGDADYSVVEELVMTRIH